MPVKLPCKLSIMYCPVLFVWAVWLIYESMPAVMVALAIVWFVVASVTVPLILPFRSSRAGVREKFWLAGGTKSTSVVSVTLDVDGR